MAMERRGTAACAARVFGVKKIGEVRIGARHARPDRQAHPAASRPDQPPEQVPLLSLIAGMAHSTLKSRAATRNGVAFGASAEDPEWPPHPAKGLCSVIVRSGSGCG